MLSWDDIRVALTLSEAGSLSRAAKTLGVDPTTVSRRVTALEADLGVPLFVRLSTGWRPTEPGERVLAAARDAALAMRRAERVAEEDQAPAGVVRVTAMESVASGMVIPTLPVLARTHPNVAVHLVCTPRTLDLDRGDADIALRIGRPKQAELIAKRLTMLREHVYASKQWLDANNLKADDIHSLDGLPLLQVAGRHPEMLRPLGNFRAILRSNSVTTVLRGVEAGAGVALLPDVVARRVADVVPLTALPAREELPLWLVAHRDTIRIPRVRVVFDAIAAVQLPHS